MAIPSVRPRGDFQTQFATIALLLDQIERLGGGYYRHRGRIDDMISIKGVKTSSEELRSAIADEAVYDVKPIAVDVDGSGHTGL